MNEYLLYYKGVFILIEALKDWKKEQWVKQQLTGAELLKPSSIVFSNDDGTVRSYSGTRKIFDKYAKKYVFFGKIHFSFISNTYGSIEKEKRGEFGWSFDRIFVPKNETRTLAEMPDDERWKFWTDDAYLQLKEYLEKI